METEQAGAGARAYLARRHRTVVGWCARRLAWVMTMGRRFFQREQEEPVARAVPIPPTKTVAAQCDSPDTKRYKRLEEENKQYEEGLKALMTALLRSRVRETELRDISLSMDAFMEESIREITQSLGPSAIAVSGENKIEYSERTKKKIADLRQFKPTVFDPDASSVAINTANAIATIGCLYDTTAPLLEEHPELREKLDKVISHLMKVVETEEGEEKQKEEEKEQPILWKDQNKMDAMLKATYNLHNSSKRFTEMAIVRLNNGFAAQHDLVEALDGIDPRI